MKSKLYIFFLLVIGFLSCKREISKYESDNLVVEQLTTNTFRHISYLSTEKFGKVSCNGMVVIDNNEALIFDTPTNNIDSKDLINWVENTLNCNITGVVVTHFHVDCLGGLNEFHKRKIPSYASHKTIALAKNDKLEVPQIGFENYLEIKIGNKKVMNQFFGEGHTSDNIVSYFPSEKVLFGGCLIKTIDANKGYLGDANIEEWSRTVVAVQSKFVDAKVIIPGHGKPGNKDLLDYTIELFKLK